MSGSRIASAGHALKHEFVIWGWVSLYLFVLFTAIAAYVWAKGGAEGRLLTDIGASAVRAIVLGKFVLLGKIFGVGAVSADAPLVHRVLVRSAALLVIVALFVVLEEVVVAMIHGGTLRDGIHELAGRGGADLLASMLLFFLILLPLALLQEVVRQIPAEELTRHLFKGAR